MKKLILALLIAISSSGTAFASTHRLHFCVTSPAGRSCKTWTWKEHRTSHKTAQPVAAVMYVPVTGYSWGCGTPNGQTASGIVPYVGVVATGGTNDYLPFGTRIYVPSLGYHGIVEDRGQGEGGFDLFSPSCAYADSVIGNVTRKVIVY